MFGRFFASVFQLPIIGSALAESEKFKCECLMNYNSTGNLLSPYRVILVRFVFGGRGMGRREMVE